MGIVQREKERKLNRKTYGRTLLPCQMKEFNVVTSGEYGHIWPKLLTHLQKTSPFRLIKIMNSYTGKSVNITTKGHTNKTQDVQQVR